MFGNISHYQYVQNKGVPVPAIRDQILWHNDLNEYKYEVLVDFIPQPFFKHPKANNLLLKTTYPGLLIGSGYAHPALHKPKTKDAKDKGDFQLGFFLDHTTGLPVIPGSSVKGVLKSVFPSVIKENYAVEKKNEINRKNTSKLEYINDILKKQEIEIDININNWQKIFFERKQVFLDAYLTSIDDGNITVVSKVKTNTLDMNGRYIYENEVQQEKRLFAEDYITPHHDIFKDPIPIRFLKVASGVTFTFQFLLKNYLKSDVQKLAEGEADSIILSADIILKIFKQILLDFGIGAKRNVGYGQFCEAN